MKIVTAWRYLNREDILNFQSLFEVMVNSKTHTSQ